MNLNDKKLGAYRKNQKAEDERAQYTNTSPPVPGLVKVPVTDKQGAESSYRRVAKFLLLIGVDEAARVMAGLAPEQIEKVVLEIASIRRVDPDEAAFILAEFESLMQRAREPSGGVGAARQILETAFGAEKAGQMLRKAVPGVEGRPFDYLDNVDPLKLVHILSGELPAIKAMVLSQLKPEIAAGVLKAFTDEEKKETVLRLARLKTINPDALRRVDEAIREKIQNINTTSADSIDGRSALAEILRRMDGKVEQEILDNLAGKDPDLGRDIRERLFTIDDIIKADDRFVQETLRPMSEHDLAVLITAKSESFRVKVLSNLSRTRSALVLEDEKLIAPLSRAESERVTSAFFSLMRRAWEDGKFSISGRDEEEVWVK